MKRCPICGEMNNKDRVDCLRCGIPFDIEITPKKNYWQIIRKRFSGIPGAITLGLIATGLLAILIYVVFIGIAPSQLNQFQTLADGITIIGSESDEVTFSKWYYNGVSYNSRMSGDSVDTPGAYKITAMGYDANGTLLDTREVRLERMVTAKNAKATFVMPIWKNMTSIVVSVDEGTNAKKFEF